MMPVENEDLNRRVQELLQRGLIREILGPCAVPYIMSPRKEENEGCALIQCPRTILLVRTYFHCHEQMI